MKVKILFAQRKCSYPGQYAPEALEVADEYSDDENPDYILNISDSYKSTREFSSLAIIAVEISDSAIEKRLNPADEVVKVKVVE